MYKITYEDGTLFNGGTPAQSGWNNISNKPIKNIEYVLGNKKIVLEGYEMYNHLVEYVTMLGKGQQISKIILMGLEGNYVTKIIFNIKKHSIERQNVKLGYEYNGGITTGWKKGVKKGTGSFNLFSKN